MGPRRTYPSLPVVGAGAVVVRRGKILLVRRNNPPNKGLWAIPGGLVELGETPEQAAVREVREEVGLDVSLERLLYVASAITKDKEGRIVYHYILVDYLARSEKGRVRLNEESSAYRWVSPSGAAGLKIVPSTRACLKKCAPFLPVATPDVRAPSR